MSPGQRALRSSRHLQAAALCALACLLPLPALAQEGFAGLCAVLVHQEQVELEDFELAVRQGETDLAVAEELFMLVDGLYHNDLFERLPYLGIKHRRDVAAINLQQAESRLDRQRAVVDQYGLACSALADSPADSEGADDLEQSRGRYREAECALRALDVAAFEVDLEYFQEILSSRADLRQSDIASRQQVLFAEQDVELTTQRLELARQRVAGCVSGQQ